MSKAKQPKRRVKENVWGNWYGYESNRRVIEFPNMPWASPEELANEWLARKENDEGSLASMNTGKGFTYELESKHGNA